MNLKYKPVLHLPKKYFRVKKILDTNLLKLRQLKEIREDVTENLAIEGGNIKLFFFFNLLKVKIFLSQCNTGPNKG